MEKQQSGSEYRMLSSFSRDELYALVEERGQVGIHLGGSWYGVLKTIGREQIKEPYSNLVVTVLHRIFIFSDHKGYDEEWDDMIKEEAYQGYKYAYMIFYEEATRRWVFPDYKIFINGITLYDI